MDIPADLEDTYVKITNIINSFILKNEIECLDYKWSYFFNKIVEDHDIDVFPHTFTQTSQGGVSGMLVKDCLGVTLTYNKLDFVFRQNFSKCHELSHFIFHLKNHNENMIFKDMSTSYDDASADIELEANIAASIILLPDIVLIKLMKTSISFIKMAEKLEMSQAALYVRMVQFLEFNLSTTNVSARRVVNSFRYDGSKELFKLYISGFGCTIEKQIVLSFENML